MYVHLGDSGVGLFALATFVGIGFDDVCIEIGGNGGFCINEFLLVGSSSFVDICDKGEGSIDFSVDVIVDELPDFIFCSCTCEWHEDFDTRDENFSNGLVVELLF